MSFPLIPRMSEKAYFASQKTNVYTFVVPSNVNREMVRQAVESHYSVTVTSVNISVLKGKAKKVNKKRGRQISGQTQAIKKAYVTLKQGDSLPVFVTDDEAKAEAAAAQKGRK